MLLVEADSISARHINSHLLEQADMETAPTWIFLNFCVEFAYFVEKTRKNVHDPSCKLDFGML